MDVLTAMLEQDCWLMARCWSGLSGLDERQLDTPLLTGEVDSSVMALLTHLVWQKHQWVAAIEGTRGRRVGGTLL